MSESPTEAAILKVLDWAYDKAAEGFPHFDSANDLAESYLKGESPTPSRHFLSRHHTLTSADVRWPLTVEGNPHLLIAGLPGMGKTTCLLTLCKQMIAVKALYFCEGKTRPVPVRLSP